MDNYTYSELYDTVKRIQEMPMGKERTKMKNGMIDRIRIEYGEQDEKAHDLIYYLKQIW